MATQLNPKDTYERKMLELLLRHELPDDVDVQIEVSPRGGGKSGTARFSLDRGGIDVKSNIDSLGLRRTVPTCW